MPAKLLKTLVVTSALRGLGFMPGKLTDEPQLRNKFLWVLVGEAIPRTFYRWAGEDVPANYLPVFGVPGLASLLGNLRSGN
ncbi:hypothetical protein BDR26DRAFT_345838 [Obelidium mucronatum]|nr:hypothetical protein BDR26DRAFT_345838 [Obelidium mucronatum]